MRGRKPSPTAIIAVAALLITLGGATIVLASETSPPEKVCVPTKAGKPVLTPLTSGLCKAGYTLTEVGKPGPEGQAGPKGETGAKGERGLTGEAGTALAYAHVSKTGVVSGATSKGFGTVENPEPGVYCISGLIFAPRNVVATIDANESVEAPELLPTFITATLGKSKFAEKEHVCTNRPPQVTVETWSPIVTNEGGKIRATTASSGFYIAIN